MKIVTVLWQDFDKIRVAFRVAFLRKSTYYIGNIKTKIAKASTKKALFYAASIRKPRKIRLK